MFNKKAIVSLNTFAFLIILFLLLFSFFYFTYTSKIDDIKKNHEEKEIILASNYLKGNLIQLLNTGSTSLQIKKEEISDNFIFTLNNSNIVVNSYLENDKATYQTNLFGTKFCSSYEVIFAYNVNFNFNGSCISLS